MGNKETKIVALLVMLMTLWFGFKFYALQEKVAFERCVREVDKNDGGGNISYTSCGHLYSGAAKSIDFIYK